MSKTKSKAPAVQDDAQVMREILKCLKQLVQIQKAGVEHETGKPIKLNQ